jgi:hypothetical protein
VRCDVGGLETRWFYFLVFMLVCVWFLLTLSVAFTMLDD